MLFEFRNASCSTVIVEPLLCRCEEQVTRLNIVILALLVICSSALSAQEVVIPDFPAGVGSDVAPAFFEPYYPQLQALADTLTKHSAAHIVVTGGADGLRYNRYNNVRNPALALGRAQVQYSRFTRQADDLQDVA